MIYMRRVESFLPVNGWTSRTVAIRSTSGAVDSLDVLTPSPEALIEKATETRLLEMWSADQLLERQLPWMSRLRP